MFYYNVLVIVKLVTVHLTRSFYNVLLIAIFLLLCTFAVTIICIWLIDLRTLHLIN
jgi:hypothetical protein